MSVIIELRRINKKDYRLEVNNFKTNCEILHLSIFYIQRIITYDIRQVVIL